MLEITPTRRRQILRDLMRIDRQYVVDYAIRNFDTQVAVLRGICTSLPERPTSRDLMRAIRLEKALKTSTFRGWGFSQSRLVALRQLYVAARIMERSK